MVKMRILGLLSVACLCLPPAAFAGRLVFGTPKVDGENVIVPINLTGDNGKGVSTMNFDMKYDPSVFQPVYAGEGAATKAADKQVQFHVRSDGDARVIIVGLNQNSIQNGEVANVVLKKIGNGDSSNVRIVNTTFAAADATEVPSRGDSQAIQMATNNDSNSNNSNNNTTDNSQNQTNSNANQNKKPADQNKPQNQTNPTLTDTATETTPLVQRQMASDKTTGIKPGTIPVGALESPAGKKPAKENLTNLTNTVKQADSVRATIATPPAATDEANANASTAAEGAMDNGDSATKQAAAPAGTNATATKPTQLAKVLPGSDNAKSAAVAGPGGKNAATSEAAAAQNNAKPTASVAKKRFNVLFIIVGVVVVGIVGLFLLRNKLFA